jgi:hypothetical protein
MSGRTNEGFEDSGSNSRLALDSEAFEASLFAGPEPNVEAIYAPLPNHEAETGSFVHPILELVSLLHCLANR